MKLLTFAVPCYNSAAYMRKCVDSLLRADGDDTEIILIDDGSKDDTGKIADDYAARFPEKIRVIHQENGGHGEGVNQGLRNAQGLYYKVVDSDDWVDEAALKTLLANMRRFVQDEIYIDMYICNYVYERVYDGTTHTMRYTHALPTDRIFTWSDIGHFRVDQQIMMHAVFYRTQLLRDMHLELPKHTFYVDSLFVYLPLPKVESMYYLNIDVYRYFIGRADQSVNMDNIIKRIDQQMLVARLMTEGCDLQALQKKEPKLYAYMFNYLMIIYAVCLLAPALGNTPELLEKRKAFWQETQENYPWLFKKLKYQSLAGVASYQSKTGVFLIRNLYGVARKIYKFN